ncbi:MAG: uridine kinase [Pseudomonadota bacterium]
MKPFLVGIAGGTASGKTTLAAKLLEVGGQEDVVIIELDRYYRSQEHLTLEQRALSNYDHPDALEFNLLIDHLNQLCAGSSIDAPHYDFPTHSRDHAITKHIKPLPVIIVEGILVFAEPKLRQLFDLKIFVDTPEEIRFDRRLARDTKERGRSVESVQEQWRATVQPMHLEFCEPGRAFADVIVSEGSDLIDVTATLWSDISERARQSS